MISIKHEVNKPGRSMKGRTKEKQTLPATTRELFNLKQRGKIYIELRLN
jgi:hypothetical protein